MSSIVVPDNVKVIKSYAFSGCSNLSQVTIGKNVTQIGSGIFEESWKVKLVIVKSSKIKSISKSAFGMMGSNLVIKVPKQRLSAYKQLFKNKGNKTLTVKS